MKLPKAKIPFDIGQFKSNWRHLVIGIAIGIVTVAAAFSMFGKYKNTSITSSPTPLPSPSEAATSIPTPPLPSNSSGNIDSSPSPTPVSYGGSPLPSPIVDLQPVVDLYTDLFTTYLGGIINGTFDLATSTVEGTFDLVNLVVNRQFELLNNTLGGARDLFGNVRYNWFNRPRPTPFEKPKFAVPERPKLPERPKIERPDLRDRLQRPER